MDISAIYRSVPARYPELKGRVAVVTGAGRGIGQGIAVRLAREGMRVVLADYDAQNLEATTAALRAQGVVVLDVLADLSRMEGIDRLFDTTLSAFDAVDVLVNNAADLRRVHFLPEHPELLDYQLTINLKAPYVCSQRAAQTMKDAGGGSIVHISSVGGLRAHHRAFPYDVMKGGLDAMTRAMAVELGVHGIRVNAIGPGPIATERANVGREPEDLRAIEGRVPLVRFGSPLEIGATVAFLASPDAGFITGQVLYVDGGITAQLSPSGNPL